MVHLVVVLVTLQQVKVYIAKDTMAHKVVGLVMVVVVVEAVAVLVVLVLLV